MQKFRCLIFISLGSQLSFLDSHAEPSLSYTNAIFHCSFLIHLLVATCVDWIPRRIASSKRGPYNFPARLQSRWQPVFEQTRRTEHGERCVLAPIGSQNRARTCSFVLPPSKSSFLLQILIYLNIGQNWHHYLNSFVMDERTDKPSVLWR